MRGVTYGIYEYSPAQMEEMREILMRPNPGIGQDHPAVTREIAEHAARTAKERRERIATAVLSGIAARGGDDGISLDNPGIVAEYAVEWADALIERLDRT